MAVVTMTNHLPIVTSRASTRGIAYRSAFSVVGERSAFTRLAQLVVDRLKAPIPNGSESHHRLMLITVVAGLAGAGSGMEAWRRCRHLPRLGSLYTALTFGICGTAACILATSRSEGPEAWIVLHLAAGGFSLALIDGFTGKLPRIHVLTLYPTTVLVLLNEINHDRSASLLLAGIGALLLWSTFFAMATRGAMGAGDVRLAPVIGAHLGQAGISTFLIGTAAAFFIGGLVALFLISSRRIHSDHRLPFGPALIAAAVLTLAA